ncbi:MAG: peptide MFS transporter [Calditrichia bacterium]
MFKQHPKGMVVLFFTEMWERFGFYLMSAIYVLFMDKVLGFDDSTKGNFYAFFLLASYIFPLLGGWLGDRILGQLKTVKLGVVLMLAGYISLALSGVGRLAFFYAGLALVAIGTGIFKVNMSVLVGNLYRKRPDLKDSGFNIYYMGVNVGATIGPLGATILGVLFNSYTAGFWAAAVGMVLAFGVLLYGTPLLREADHRGGVAAHPDQPANPNAAKEFWPRVITLGILFLIASFFWVPFYQNGFALTLFADRSTVPYKFLRPETYMMFNAIFILLLTPPVLWVYSLLRRRNLEPATPVKIFLGLLIMGVGMLVMVLASLLGGNLDQPIMSPFWLITAYFFITLAEILISPMGQSYVSKVAPPQIQGLMMGGWFGATALGAMSSGLFGKLYSDFAHHQYFLVLAGLSFFAAILILLFMKKLKRFGQ